MTVVPIQDDADSPVQIDDIADALDRQIDLMWALIAGLQTIQSVKRTSRGHAAMSAFDPKRT